MIISGEAAGEIWNIWSLLGVKMIDKKNKS